jgi:hypothetical protein
MMLQGVHTGFGRHDVPHEAGATLWARHSPPLEQPPPINAPRLP